MNKLALRTEGLHKTYQRGRIKTQALRGVSLAIPRGTFCCIVGPSGHGKSTLMHMLGALDRPTAGQVFIEDQDIGSLSSSALAALRARRIGFVFQFFNLLPNLTALENVTAAMMFSNREKAQRAGRARELLDLVGLSDKYKARPNELSGGQQQRVAIARALANEPDILLMDEPTGNLDSEAEAEVMANIEQLHQQGKTIVIVTHSAEIAARAQQVIRVKDGVLVKE
ncbi:putative ABC transport system ATP-binding protein [Geoalkalibacter ferrihydriticus]|uniref:ABC transporter ATP-binding protein n=2 Tax=Geoalkalibacter ferrihydriticus TaxID=392333 RepID=A0A0C2HLC5_9BACT|nr:ABC transporter ATP-binding protein [Geoalkalibacter ferrihydriticus]KIH75795.1 ABC transporter ATP-binding protein [Geoalkalibacter ferrihydriticus DSM 17813]SDM65461.1 putative ABC transport system ATP-binding protein [Geoalkalibacter ferrihydriticus]